MANEHNYGDSVDHYVLQELTSEDKKYAKTYLNETNETKENAITEIKRWVDNELYIKIDDFLILRYLRICKFNFEKTKIKIRHYYKLRNNLPEWFMNTDPLQSELQKLLNLGFWLPLRKPDNKGRIVLIFRVTRSDPRIYKISDVFKIGIMIIELAVKNYTAASVYGFTMVIDSINPTIRHMIQFGPTLLKNLASSWQNYPVRLQLVNVINAPMFLDVSFRLFKSFLSEKMKNRFYVYPDISPSYFKDVPANILPIEYGGTDGTCQELAAYWKKLIEENRNWFTRDDNVKVNNISEQ